MNTQEVDTPMASADPIGTAAKPIRSILRHLDAEAVSAAARRETRNREVHLPPVTVYRWWARRTESVFGAIIDAFSQDYLGHLLIADPFVGGGVIPLAAILRGHRVYAQDVNPWATFGLATMLALPETTDIRAAAERLHKLAEPLLHAAYGTTFSDGSPALIAHTFRVATAECSRCKTRARLFPHALISLLRRKERGEVDAFLACPAGHLFLGHVDRTGICDTCRAHTDPSAAYTRGRLVVCQTCSHSERLEERARSGSWKWEVILVERAGRRRREIAIPSPGEIAQAEAFQWAPARDLGTIPDGKETRVLLRHGFGCWADLYPRRQRVVMESLLGLCDSATDDEAVRNTLRIAIHSTAEMAGLLSRWDRWYLKSYEAMAGHRFNFTTLAAEPNVWGTDSSGRGTVGRRLQRYAKAAAWLRNRISRRLLIETGLAGSREWPSAPLSADVRVVQGSSEQMVMPDKSVDLVLTDPPYHDDVQYDELSLLLRAWARLPADRLRDEAVVKDRMGGSIPFGDYRELLTRIFAEARRILRPEGHLVFSYANREPRAWVDVLRAVEQAGLRAVGYTIVHSENETDFAKRGVGACTLDIILDLVSLGDRAVEQWSPTTPPSGPEEDFLRTVGDTFLQLGELRDGWETAFVDILRASHFLNVGKSTTS